jgi:hypothetical protein
MVIQRMVVRFFNHKDGFLDLNRVFLMIFVICPFSKLILKTVGLLLVVEEF